MTSSKKIWKFFTKKQKKQSFLLIIFILFVTSLEIIGISSFFPIISAIIDYNSLAKYSFIYNFSQNFSQKDFIYLSLFLLFLVFLIKNITYLFLVWYQNQFVLNLELDLVSKIYRIYLNSDYLFHTKNNSALLVRNINNEVSSTKFYINTNFNLLVEFFLLIAILLIIFFLEPIATLITVTLAAILTSVLYFYTKQKLNNLGKNKITYSGNVNKILLSSLQGIKEVQILDKQDDFYFSLSETFKKLNKLQLNFIILTSIPRVFLEIIIIFSFVIFVLVLIFANQDLTKIISTLAIFSISFVRILPSITKIIQNLQFRKYFKPSFDLIFNELEMLKKINLVKKNNLTQIKEFEVNESDIIIDDVSFNYPDTKKKILNKVSIKISFGEMIGVIGSSGVGKTTFIDCILGLLNPTSGTIFFNNVNIHSNIRQWQKKIGYVSQLFFLLDTTLEKNIAFELENHPPNENLMEYAINSAKLLDLKNKLNNSIDPNIGENGIKLSGGQKQRIAIARALYRNTSILILDEFTNSLDKKTESEILDLVASFKKKKTIIIVSHDKQVLKYCDRIISINNGLTKEISLSDL
jgi:ABC-type multidrug transport system fused ATPase/permease subunit